MNKKVAFIFKAFYVLRFLGQGVFYPYVVLYLASKGLGGAQLGVVMMMLPLSKVLFAPVSGYFSDLYHIHKKVLIASMLLISVGGAYLFFLSHSFLEYFLAALIFALGEVSVDPLVNTLAVDYLGRSGDQNDFGRWRLWGAIGFLAGALPPGFIGMSLMLPVTPLVYAGASFIAFLIAFSLPRASAKKPVDWLGGIKLVSRNQPFALMLAGVMLSGIGFNVLMNYYAVYMTGIGASSWIISFGVAAQTLVEIALSANTRWILTRFPLRMVYLSGFLTQPMRALLYIVNRSPWVGLLIQNLHGFYVFSVFIVGVIVLDATLQPEWRSTGQSYYSSAFAGFGGAIGALVAPLLFDRNGITVVFAFAMAASVFGYLFVSLTTRRLLPGAAPVTDIISE